MTRFLTTAQIPVYPYRLASFADEATIKRSYRSRDWGQIHCGPRTPSVPAITCQWCVSHPRLTPAITTSC